MSRLSRNVAANYVGTIWASIVQIAFVPTYIKYLGLESYGLIGVYTSLMVWISLADLGFTPTLTREIAKFTSGIRSAQWIANFLHSIERILWAIGLVAIAGSVLIAHWAAEHWFRAEQLGVDQISFALICIALSVVLKWLSNTYRGGIIGLQDQIWLNFANIFFITVRNVGILPVLIFVDSDVRLYFLYTTAITAIELICIRYHLRSLLRGSEEATRFDWSAIREVFKFASGLTAISALGIALTQTDKVILSRLLDLKTFGAYSFATTVASILVIVGTPLFNALYPRLSEQVAQGDTEGRIATYRRGCEIIISIAVAVAFGLLCFWRPVISVWVHDASIVQSISPYFFVLVIANMFYAITHVPFALQLAHGWTALSVRLNLAAYCILLPSLLLLVPDYGAKAAAWAWLSINLLLFFVQISIVNHRARLIGPVTWFLYLFAPPAITGGAYFLSMHTVMQGLHTELTSALGLVAILAICALGLIVTACSTGAGRQLIRTILTNGGMMPASAAPDKIKLQQR